MAELILTTEEKAAALWSDLDDAAIGKLVKKKMEMLQTHFEQIDRAVTFGAALLICCDAAERNAREETHEIFGVTHDGRNFGDWLVTAKRMREGGK
jgi:Flp pilus assembly protein TadB